jgi:hypothetical protein
MSTFNPPGQSQLVLFKLSNARVTRGRFMNGTHEPCHFEGFTPTWPWVKVIEWAVMPSPDDPGWVMGEPPGHEPSPGREVFALGHRGYVQIRETDERQPVLPGFMGGEHRLFDSVKAWREIESLAWQPVPAEIRDREPAWMTRDRLRAEWQAQTRERVSEELYLAIVNDGDIYRRLWGPLADGQTIRVERCLVRMEDWRQERKVGRMGLRASALLLRHVMREVLKFATQPENRPEIEAGQFEISYGLWQSIFKETATALLDHYQRVRLEALTAASSCSPVAS